MVYQLKNMSGVGGPMSLAHPDGTPATFDPATSISDTQKKIYQLLEKYKSSLTAWEWGFIADIYNKEPLTRKQHIKVYNIWKRCNGTS